MSVENPISEVLPSVLTEMQYQTPGLGYLPILEGKVRHLITWGPDSQDMAPGLGKNGTMSFKRIVDVMAKNNMVPASKMIFMQPRMNVSRQILEVDEKILTSNSKTGINKQEGFVCTTSHDIALAVRSENCPIAIMYSIQGSGKPLLGLLRAGIEVLNKLVPVDAVRHITNVSGGCDPKDIVVGITPSINAEHYYFKQDELRKLIFTDAWNKNARPKENSDKIELNMLDYLINQLMNAGIAADHIQPYSTEVFGELPPGRRYFVAAQLES
jgi:copper oxidase (laccase) domain-containing protein